MISCTSSDWWLSPYLSRHPSSPPFPHIFLGCEDGGKMRPPSPLLILLYITLSKSVKVVSKRGSGIYHALIPFHREACPLCVSHTVLCMRFNVPLFSVCFVVDANHQPLVLLLFRVLWFYIMNEHKSTLNKIVWNLNCKDCCIVFSWCKIFNYCLLLILCCKAH